MSYSHQHNDSVSSTTSTASDSSDSSDSSSSSSSSSSSNTQTTASIQTWVNVTIIEDDDLMFGGKPLSTWYEEDRRCSVTEEGDALSPCSTVEEAEAEDRGRRRDRH